MRAGKTRPAATVTVIAAAVSLAINIALVPLIGILGATVGTLVAYIVMLGLSVRYSQSLLALPRPNRRLGFEVTASVAIVFAALLLPVSAPFLILRGAVGIACGLLLLGMIAVLGKTPANPLLRYLSHWVNARVGV